jgi:hypothetical protein
MEQSGGGKQRSILRTRSKSRGRHDFLAATLQTEPEAKKYVALGQSCSGCARQVAAATSTSMLHELGLREFSNRVLLVDNSAFKAWNVSLKKSGFVVYGPRYIILYSMSLVLGLTF